jgi:hypothetical protein
MASRSSIRELELQQAASNLALSEELMSTELALEVVSVERIDGAEVIVEFSDSTWASYPAEELAGLRPVRRKIDSPSPGMDNHTKR